MNAKFKRIAIRLAISALVGAPFIATILLTSLGSTAVAINGFAGSCLWLALVSSFTYAHGYLNGVLMGAFNFTIESNSIVAYIVDASGWLRFGLATVLAAAVAPSLVAVSSSGAVMLVALSLSTASLLSVVITEKVLARQ